jgi:hypothetical protein
MSDNEEVVQEEEYQSTINDPENSDIEHEESQEEESQEEESQEEESQEEEDNNEEDNNDEEEDNNDEEEDNNDEEEEDNNGEEQNDEEEDNNGEEEEEEEEDEEEDNNGEEEEENDDEEDNNEVEEEEEDDEEEMSEEECIKYFKESVKEYLKLEEEIKTLDKASKIRKEKRKNIGDSILSFIQQKDISHVKLQGNYKGRQIENHQTVKKTNVSFKSVTNIIFEHFDNIDDAKNLMDKINGQRLETNVSRLRIAKDKKKKTSAFKLQNLVDNNTMKSELSEQVPEHMQYLYTTTVQN